MHAHTGPDEVADSNVDEHDDDEPGWFLLPSREGDSICLPCPPVPTLYIIFPLSELPPFTDPPDRCSDC